MTVTSPQGSTTQSSPGLNPLALGRGLAVIRILLGLAFLLNGLSKFLDWTRIDVLGLRASLIGRDDAAGILQRQGLDSNGGKGTALPFIQSIAQFMLDHYTVVQWLLAATETIAGLLLVLGLVSRLGGLLGLMLALFVAALYYSSGSWLLEEPLIWVPLVVLTLVESGRVWGLDARRSPRKWPL